MTTNPISLKKFNIEGGQTEDTATKKLVDMLWISFSAQMALKTEDKKKIFQNSQVK